MKFPRDFIWGASTAAHQVEGNNINSDWWQIENMPNSPVAEPSGAACDSYNRYAEDMQIIKNHGLNAYRFSIEWARIEPEQGVFDENQIDHYRRMIAKCVEIGLEPIVTLHHFTFPAWFRAMGHWTHPDAANIFARYCKKVAPLLEGCVNWVITINEPNIHTMILAAQNGKEGRYFLPLPEQKVVDGLIKAHHAARSAISEVSSLRTGWSIANLNFYGVQGASTEKVKEISWAGEDQFIHQSLNDDFIGVQSYSRTPVDNIGTAPLPEGARATDMHYEFFPPAIGLAIRHVASILPNTPILITENGLGTTKDEERVEYIQGALKSVEEAMADGYNIRGYCHWSLLDNFEWAEGFKLKFGLVEVDRKTFKRTPKPSFSVYQKIVERLSN
jgi:beta-glucosidase